MFALCCCLGGPPAQEAGPAAMPPPPSTRAAAAPGQQQHDLEDEGFTILRYVRLMQRRLVKSVGGGFQFTTSVHPSSFFLEIHAR